METIQLGGCPTCSGPAQFIAGEDGTAITRHVNLAAGAHDELCKLRLAIHDHKAALTEVGEWSEADAALWAALGVSDEVTNP